jgi:hypothetical protein
LGLGSALPLQASLTTEPPPDDRALSRDVDRLTQQAATAEQGRTDAEARYDALVVALADGGFTGTRSVPGKPQ